MTAYNYGTRKGYKAKTYTHTERIRRDRGEEWKLVHEEITYPPHIEEAMELIKKLQEEKTNPE